MDQEKNNQNPIAALLQELREELSDSVQTVKDRDPAARSDAEILLLYSGVHAIFAHRIAHRFYERGQFFPARAISQFSRFLTGIEIHPGAKIGKGLFIDHGMGVVIGETTEIGDNCTIYQGVTLGGTGKDVGKRHPTIGDNVMIGAGAKVLGPVKIGSGSKIASNAVVIHEVPEDSTAVGIPAKVVRRGGVRVYDQMDQVHLPDPTKLEMNHLKHRIEELEKQLAELRQKDKE